MLRILVLASLGSFGVANVDAQAVASNIDHQNVRAESLVSGGRISVEIKDMNLPDALWTIARRAGTRVTFDRSKLPAKQVSYDAVNVTPYDAIAAVLGGTGFRVNRAHNGTFEIIKAGDQPRRAQGVIAGKVTEAKTGKGITGVRVSLENDGRATTTGEDGTYRLAGVAAGTHTVTVRLVGYAKQSRVITLGEGATVTADFRLDPSANVLDQVVVTGTVAQTELKAVPSAITVITAKQIEERGITRIDQLFRGDIPGLFSFNLGSSVFLDEVTMFSRGATALQSGATFGSANTENLTNPIKTYIDGVEMASPKYLSQIDPSTIERIEILTGPQASTIYGSNALNGVMQIFTRRGSSPRPRVNLNLSSGFAQNNFSDHLTPNYLADIGVSGVEGRWSYNVGGSWNYIGSWTPGRQTQRLSANGGGRMEVNKFTVDASTRRGLTQNKQTGGTLQGRTALRTGGVFTPLSVSDVATPVSQSLNGTTYGLTLSYRPVSLLSAEAGVGSDAYETQSIATGAKFGGFFGSDTLLSASLLKSSRQSQRFNTTLQLPIASLARLNLTAGGDHWRTAGSSWSGNGLALTGSLSGATVTRNKPLKNSGAFVQGQLGLWDALFLTYGVRADWNPAFGDKAKVKPGRYGASYTRDIETPLGSISTKLRGSYGRSIRPPGDDQAQGLPVTSATVISLFGPHSVIIPNEDLGPEHQQGGEGGVELYFGNRGSIVVTRYNQTVDNLISRVGSELAAFGGPGVDSVRSLAPNNIECSSTYRDPDGYCYRYQLEFLNVGSIRNQGWETQGSINVGPLTTRGTYSWTKSRIVGVTPRYASLLTTSEFQRGRSFDVVPEHTWAVSFSYAQAASSLALFVNGIGPRYISLDQLSLASDATNTRLVATRPRMSLTSSQYRPSSPRYAIADLNGTHRFSRRVDATLQVSNLTDSYKGDTRIDYAMTGRQTKVGLRLRLD